jgi:integrase/recombinase XerD
MTDKNYIDEFIAYIGLERGLSLNTQLSYGRDLQAAYDFAQENNLPWPMNYEALNLYLSHLQNNGFRETSQVRMIISIKMFLRFLQREGLLLGFDGTFLQCPKIWKTVPSMLSFAQLKTIMNQPDLTTDEGIRDRAILEMLYGTGMRVSELCQLTFYDLSDDTVRLFGKGRKERLVPVGKQTLSAVDRYLHFVRSKWNSEKEVHLFVSSRGKPLDRMKVWKIVRYYVKKAGIDKKISPHTFRHTYASHLLESGADLRVIQELLGHAHISSTDRYTQITGERVKEAFKALHPRWKG